MFESLFFSMLMKPIYEKPVDTAQDVLDRGLKIIYPPGTEFIVETMKNSDDAVLNALAKITVVAKVIFVILKTFRYN